MNTRRIIIVGPSGSGKTTVAEAIARELNLPVVSMDDFRSKGKCVLQFYVDHRGKKVKNFEDPRLWDENAIACKLRACIQAGQGFVAEGNHLLAYPSIAAILDTERYYLDVPHKVSVARRKTRHRYLPADESFILIGEEQTRLIVAPQLAMPDVIRLDGTLHTYVTGSTIIHRHDAPALR
jgi:shikimate kinase